MLLYFPFYILLLHVCVDDWNKRCTLSDGKWNNNNNNKRHDKTKKRKRNKEVKLNDNVSVKEGRRNSAPSGDPVS